MAYITRRQFLAGASSAAAWALIDPLDSLAELVGKSYRLVANIPDFSMRLYDDSREIRNYEISVGKPNTRTPLGEYKILVKEDWGDNFAGTWMGFKENPDSNGKNSGGWGIHGYRQTKFIGNAISKGCIRMTPEEAKELKGMVPIGTPLKNVYETVALRDGVVEISTDIYSLEKNFRRHLAEKMGVDERLLNSVRADKVWQEAGNNKHAYIKAVKEFRRQVGPLDSDFLRCDDIIEKMPVIAKCLETMERHKKLLVETGELLL